MWCVDIWLGVIRRFLGLANCINYRLISDGHTLIALTLFTRERLTLIRLVLTRSRRVESTFRLIITSFASSFLITIVGCYTCVRLNGALDRLFHVIIMFLQSERCRDLVENRPR